MRCQQNACPFLTGWCILRHRNMKTYIKIVSSPFSNRGWITLLVLALSISGVVGLIHTQTALAAAKTAEAYCKDLYGKDANNFRLNACKDGLNGTDCQNYTDAQFEAEVVKACTDAVEALSKPDVVKPGNFEVPDKPTTGTGSNNGSSGGSSQGASDEDLEQTKDLSEYLDVLHKKNEKDKDADLEKEDSGRLDKYINGAGKLQDLVTIKPGTGSSPAILFINGGGWLGNDQTGQHVANGDEGAEKAGDRGYAMYDITYRYGTSGVYYQFEDVMRGIEHVMRNAKEYGIDPEKVVIWGDSAGGSLSMRAAASGKTGAKAAVGWSPPTNAYTAVFRSFQSFGIGVAHSTCAPTDLAGLANFADSLNGGSGDVAEHGQGISSNDFSALGIMGTPGSGIDPLSLMTQAVVAGRNASSAMQDVESISNKIMSGNTGSLVGSTFNLAGKMFNECIDNFNALSPALFTSPDTPPSFLAGYDNDGVINPNQITGMRDKLRQLGIRSESLILPGVGSCLSSPTASGPAGSGGCHLGYHPDFVCPTLNFIDSVVQPGKGTKDCGSGVAVNTEGGDAAPETPDIASAGGDGSSSSGGGGSSSGSGSGSSGGGSSGGSNNSNNSSNNSNSNTTAQQRDKCLKGGGSWADRDGDGKSSCSYPPGWVKTCQQTGDNCTTQPSIPGASNAPRKVCGWPTKEEQILCQMGINPK